MRDDSQPNKERRGNTREKTRNKYRKRVILTRHSTERKRHKDGERRNQNEKQIRDNRQPN